MYHRRMGSSPSYADTLGWWWADPVAALVVPALAAVDGTRSWRAESLADTCCA